MRSSRLTIAGTLLAGIAALGCGDSNDPAIEVPVVLLVQHPALDGGTGAGTLQLAKAHVVVTMADDAEEVLDTLITIGSAGAQTGSRHIAMQTTGSAGQIRIEFDVELPGGSSADGEDLLVSVDLQNAGGTTLFHAGPIPVTADPNNPPAPVQMFADYVGTGSAATSVELTPASASVAPGASFDFVATARDAAGNALPGTPVEFTSLHPGIATVPDKSVGHAVAGTARGTATIKASLITGQVAQATLTVQPPAAVIAAQSGANQTAAAGSVLQPFVVKVTAADGLGVSGVPVTFAVVVGTGSLSALTAATDASGFASTTLTLPATAGIVTVTASVAGVSGSPISFSATSTAGAASALAFTSQPVDALAGANLAPITVQVRDALGIPVTSYTGVVTLALDAPPAGVTLGGTTSVSAVNGVATFSAVQVLAGGTGLRLRASAAGVTGTALSSAFTITAGTATKLVITEQPAVGILGQPMKFKIEARTAGNALAVTYNASLTVTPLLKPAGGAIGGVVTTGFVNGIATLEFTANPAGTYSFIIRSTTLDEAVSNAIPVAAISLELVSGNAQGGQANQFLALPLVARTVDGLGAPVANVPVTWSIVSGGGTVTVVTGTSDANGLVSAQWRLGAAGAQAVQVAVGGGVTLQFTAIIAS